jgi:putative phage-type endonuclease
MSIQRTDEWWTERLGYATASRVKDIIAVGKSGPSTSRQNYLTQLVYERLNGKPYDEGPKTQAMERGIALEATARKEYGQREMVEVEEVGFLKHPRILFTGASPDGRIGSRGVVEFKCPNSFYHLEAWELQKVVGPYSAQVQWEIECAEADWCDWVSYDDRARADVAYVCIRVMRNEEEIKKLRQKIGVFLDEVAQRVDVIERLIAERAAR